MKRIKVVLVLAVAAALAFVLRPSEASSLPTCDTSWTNSAGGSWGDAANWDNGVPTASTYACVTLDGDYVVTSGSDLTVAGLTLGAADNTGAQTLQVPSGTITPGEVHLEASGTFDMTGGSVLLDSAGETFTQNGGDLHISADSWSGATGIRLSGGSRFAFVDGDTTGDYGVRLFNATLDFTGTDLPTDTTGRYYLIGDNTLEGDIPTGHVLQVRGSSDADTGLTSATGFTNAGEIVLGKTDYYGSTSLTVTDGTLVNTGTLRTTYGLGYPRYINADVDNQGTMSFDINATFNKVGALIENSGTITVPANVLVTFQATDAVLRQTTGTLDVSGAVYAGHLNFRDGTITGTGPVWVIDGTLDYTGATASPADTSERNIRLRGNNTLVGDVPLYQVLHVLGAYNTNTGLTSATGFTNNGSIIIDKDGYYGTSYLAAPDQTIINGAAGRIETQGNYGGSRYVRAASIVNEGVLFFAQDGTYLDHTGTVVENRGSFVVATAGRVYVEGDGTFLQRDGSVTFPNNGELRINTGSTFRFIDGTIGGNPSLNTGRVNLWGATLDFTGAVSSGSSTRYFDVHGISTLVGDVPSDAYIRFLGEYAQDRSLTANADFTNAGTIVLDKDEYYNSVGLSAPGRTITNTGTIVTYGNYGGNRWIRAAKVINEGELTLNQETWFDAIGETIDNRGTFTVATGTVHVDRGSVDVTFREANGGVATLTTSVAHGLDSGDAITVSGLGAGFDGTYTVASTPTDTTFTYDTTAADSVAAPVSGASVSSAATFVQRSGSIAFPTNGQLLISDTGTFAYVDGLIEGDPEAGTGRVNLWNARLDLRDAEPTGESTRRVDIHGSSSTLVGDIPAPFVIRYLAQYSCDCTLTAPASLINYGTLILDRDDNYGTVTFAIPGGTLTNAAGGRLETRGNYGYDRYFRVADLVNEGEVVLKQPTHFNAPGTTVDNRGTFDVATSGTVWVEKTNIGISARELTADVATLTTAAAHGFDVGDLVTVIGVGNPFDGTVKITDVPASNRFSYAAVGTDVPAETVNGSASMPSRFLQTSGAVTFSNAVGELRIDSGNALAFVDGTIGGSPSTGEGKVNLWNSTLDLTGSRLTPDDTTRAIDIHGSDSRLLGDVPATFFLRYLGQYSCDCTLTAPTSFTNNGTILLDRDDNYGNIVLDIADPAGVLTNGPTGTLQTFGNYGYNRSITATVDNQGTIATSASTDITAVTNTAGGTLAGGTWNLEADLRFPTDTITTNAATIRLGTSGTIRNLANGADALTGTITTNTGTLALSGGRQFPVPDLDNTGTVEIGAGSRLDGASRYTQTGAAARTNLLAADAVLDLTGGTVAIDGGTLTGIGQVIGTVTAGDGATVSPGASPGVLTITGDYTQAAGATLLADIAGTDPGSGYDRLAVTGDAVLEPGAALALSTPDYVPAVVSTYDILVAGGTLTGTFTEADTTGWDVGTDGRYYESSVANGTTARLTVFQRLVTLSRPAAATPEGTSPLTFTVTLTKAPEVSATVPYSTFVPGGSHRHATPGADYTAVDGAVLTFGPGEVTKAADVTILQDVIDEYDTEDVGAQLGVTSGNVVRGEVVAQVVAITDDDAAPVASVTLDAPIIEGDEGLTFPAYAVALTGATEKVVTVDWATVDGTATAPADYRADAGTLVFAIGDTTPRPLGLEVMTDLLNEPDETFALALTAPDDTSTVSDAAGRAVTTIVNDDPTPTLAVSGGERVTEGATGSTAVPVPVHLSAKSGQTVTVHYATSDGTATAGTDYPAASGDLTFAPGETVATIPLTVTGDGVHEGDETFTVTLSAPGNATLARSASTVTIADDDAAPVLDLTGPVNVAEGTSDTPTTATYTVTKTGATQLPATVTVATAAGTATGGRDYTPVTRTITLAPAETSASVEVTVAADAVDEPDETFSVTLAGPAGATLGTSSVTTTVTDDDAAPTIAIADAGTVAEGDTGTVPARFAVTLSAPSGQTVTVDYATTAGTAAVPGDVSGSGTVTFAAGETAKTVAVDVAGDTADEDDETFTVALADPAGADLGTASGAATIADDDDTPTLTVGDLTAAEGDAGSTALTVPVTLSAPSGRSITVDYAPVAGTATADADDTAAAGSLTFAPGDTAKTIAVAVVGDTVHEGDEGFTFVLSNPVAADIADGTGLVTITDDDAAPTLDLSGPASVTEGTSADPTVVTYTITKTGSTALPASVSVATTAGTATAGPDFTAVSRTVTLQPGDTTATVDVEVVADAADEGDETFAIGLTQPSGATLGTASVPTTITDDDVDGTVVVPTVAIDDADSVAEGSSGTTPARFVVSLSQATTRTVTVDYATTAGIASVPGDVSGSGTVTFAPGEQARTISVPVVGDALDEPDEAFTVELTNPLNATAGDVSGAATIVDDDDTPTLTVGDLAVDEGDAGVTVHDVAVTLSAPSGRDVDVDYSTTDGGSGTLHLAAGSTSATVPVGITGDVVHEDDAVVLVTLSNPVNARLARGVGAVTVTDDDAVPVLDLSGPATVTEGTGDTPTMATFSITKTGATALPASVVVTTADGTAGPDDHAVVSVPVTLAPDATSATVDIPVVADAVDEDDETFAVELSSADGATLGTASVTTSITDDDAAPTVSAVDLDPVTEGNSGTRDVDVPVLLSAPSSRTVTVDWVSNAGSGTTSGTLTFAPGETTAAVPVTVAGDTVDEDDLVVTVTLSAPVNSTIADATGTVTAVDDDDRPTVSISGPATVGESDGSATYTATLSTASGREVRVDYATSHGTTGDADLTPAAGTLVFAAGDTAESFTVAITGDDVAEPGESFTAALSGPVNAVLGSASTTTNIVDDDGAAVVNVAPVAGDDEATTLQDAAVDVDVLADDSDANGDPLSVVGSSQPGQGTVSCTLGGICTYTPAADYSGGDSFTYTVTDGNGAFDTGLVTVTVSAASASADAPAGGTVSSGDVATADEPLRIGVRTPTGGTVTITDRESSGFTATGYDVLDVEAEVTAPAATAGDPLELTFTVDAAEVVPPASSLAAAAEDLTVFRNGAPVGGACTGAGATPDPCLASVTVVGDDLVAVVRTSHASTWNFGLVEATVTPPSTTTTTTTTTTAAPTTTTTAPNPTTTTTAPAPTTTTTTKVKAATGYWVAAADGTVRSYGGALRFGGSLAGTSLRSPIVGLEATPSGLGYWLVGRDGGIFSFGDAAFYGSTGAMTLNKPIVGMSSTPTGRGYWLVASDGGIFSFGDAAFYGSTGAMTLNKPIVGMSSTPTGRGYWLVATDGGIFAFGDAGFFGSTGAMTLNKPIVGMSSTPTGRGYWLVATDGGIFAFGDAGFFGSTGAIALNEPIVGMLATPTGQGYWLVAEDGGVFTLGDAVWFGSAAGTLYAAAVGLAM